MFWLVEGDPLVIDDGLTVEALAGALSSLAIETKASVIRTETVEGAVELIAAMARHVQDGNVLGPTWRPSKPKDAALLAEFIVGGLPGIGLKSAIAIRAVIEARYPPAEAQEASGAVDRGPEAAASGG